MEAIKAKIEAIKTFFIIVTTSLFSIIAYLFLHFSFLSTLYIYVLVYGIIVSIAIDIILLIFWIKLIKKLGEFDE